MADEDRELFLDILREGTTPFDRFVSRGDLEDVIDIPMSRSAIDRSIFRSVAQTQLDQSTRMVPILGEAGAGKTHAYWAYKDKERKMKSEDADVDYQVPTGWTEVYVQSPTAANRKILNFRVIQKQISQI